MLLSQSLKSLVTERIRPTGAREMLRGVESIQREFVLN